MLELEYLPSLRVPEEVRFEISCRRLHVFDFVCVPFLNLCFSHYMNG